MLPKTPPSDDSSAFRRLYPNLSGADLDDTEDRLARYLDVARRIALRLEYDPGARERLSALTRMRTQGYDETEQSKLSSSPPSP